MGVVGIKRVYDKIDILGVVICLVWLGRVCVASYFSGFWCLCGFIGEFWGIMVKKSNRFTVLLHFTLYSSQHLLTPHSLTHTLIHSLSRSRCSS